MVIHPERYSLELAASPHKSAAKENLPYILKISNYLKRIIL
nr:hypothetical protein [Paenimyroides ceti]